MKYVDKCVLIPVEEYNTLQEQNKSLLDTKDVSTMTESKFLDSLPTDNEEKKEQQDESTMTGDSITQSSTIIVMPPGVPEVTANKRKVHIQEDKGKKGRFQWKE